MAEASQGTYIEIGTGRGSAVTPTALAVGYPTILTKASHGLSAGDVVTLSDFTGTGAGLLNGKVAIVQFVTDDTFAVGIDTTNATITCSSAKATPNAWTEVGEVKSMNREPEARPEADTTHLRSTSRESLLGLRGGGTYTGEFNWLFDDPGQQALIAAESDNVLHEFRVVFPTGDTISFFGRVQLVSGPSAGVDSELSGSMTIKLSDDLVISK